MTERDIALEIEADRILSTPLARRVRAREEAPEWTEADGRALYENVGKVRNAPPVTEITRRDLGEVAGMELGFWAGQDRVKQFAILFVRRREAMSVRHFAARQGVSESIVHRRIRQAKRLIRSLVRPA
jgi:hypothetical protein